MTSNVIAVTGGIGSGKSEVTRYLQSLGYNTVDCDKVARKVSYLPQTVAKVRELLGDEFVYNGRLNRRSIRNTIFADADLLRQYNSIFFDEVKKRLIYDLSRLNGIVFVEISVFEAFEFPWDGVWLIESNSEKRKTRVVERDGVSRKNVEDIMSCQNVCVDCTLKINNDGSLDDLKHNVDEALKMFKTNI